MEQNTITNEELHGIITDLVQKVESLECCILTLVDFKSGDKLMDTKELCEYMHKSKSTIYRITNDRLVPHIKQGNRIYFRKRDIDEWLEKNKREDYSTTLSDVEEMMAARSVAFNRNRK